METLSRDLKLALRSLARRPGFAVVAILTLAIGVAANSAVFSVFDTVLLRPLPFPEPDRLMRVYGFDRTSGDGRWNQSFPDFADLRKGASLFSGWGAYGFSPLAVVGGEGEPRRLQGVGMTHDLFPLLGIEMELGRGFNAAEDKPGGVPVVLLSWGLWQDRFGGDPEVLGRPILLGGEERVVIGVVARGQGYPEGTEVWMPAGAREGADQRGVHNLVVLARLAPGSSEEAAEAELAAVARHLEEEYPDENAHRSARLEPLLATMIRGVERQLLLLQIAVALVLLVACGNVVGLLLERVAARRSELAVRRALGASRAQITRQFLVEGLVLATVGGVLGLGLAHAGVRALVATAPVELPRLAEVGIDLRVVLVTAVILSFVGLLFGLVSALESGGRGGGVRLASAGRGAVGRSHRAFPRRFLVVAEVAAAVVLVVGVGLVLRSIVRLQSVDLGYRGEGVVTANVERQVPFITPDWQTNVSFFASLVERAEALPGVESVAATHQHPAQPGWTTSFTLTDRPAPEPGLADEANFRPVTPGYFKTVGIPLIAGRALEPRDRADSAGVVVVNRAFVETHFPGQEPSAALGVGLNKRNWWKTGLDTFEIVGVVEGVRFEGPAAEPEPTMYFPHGQMPINSMNLVVRASGDPVALIPALRQAVWALDPHLPVGTAATLEEQAAVALGRHRFVLRGLGAFAGAALLLVTVGLYGLLAYAVTRRRRELGVRLALGARGRDVMGLVVSEGLMLTAIGLAVGVVLATAAGRLLEALLFEVNGHDPLTLLAVIPVLLLVALLASGVPAWRATRVDPVRVLRQE